MNDKETEGQANLTLQHRHLTVMVQARGQWNTMFKCQTINLESYTQQNYLPRTRAE